MVVPWTTVVSMQFWSQSKYVLMPVVSTSIVLSIAFGFTRYCSRACFFSKKTIFTVNTWIHTIQFVDCTVSLICQSPTLNVKKSIHSGINCRLNKSSKCLARIKRYCSKQGYKLLNIAMKVIFIEYLSFFIIVWTICWANRQRSYYIIVFLKKTPHSVIKFTAKNKAWKILYFLP